MIFYKDNKISVDDIAKSMNDVLLNKTASKELIKNKSEKLVSDLNRASELFENVGNYKAAEVVTKIIEKIAGK